VVTSIALLALLPVSTLGVPTTASASTTNANFDGNWLVKSSTGEAHVVITGENPATGEFGGEVTGPTGLVLKIVDGEVTGSHYTFTDEFPDTVVGESGEQVSYSGTISGDSMTITQTAIRTWHDGQAGDDTISADPGPFTGTRGEFELSGMIIFGCSGTGTSCSAAAAPLYDATVDVEGPSSASTTTDTDGTWKVSVPAGHYVITPTAPGVTFTPASLDVDVTASADDQNFSGCGATSSDDADSPDLRISSHANSGAWSLKGTYCYNTYDVTYYPSTGRASVTWITKAWVCNLRGRAFMNANLGRTFYDNATVGSAATPGRAFPDGKAAIVQVQSGTDLVMSFRINPGGATGSVTTNGQTLGTTITKDGTPYFCQPVDGTNSPLPHSEKKRT
jgi:hypothetical protein